MKRWLSSDVLVMGLSAALLWHFSNIWRYGGQYLIQEPNRTVLIVETIGLVFVLVFGIVQFIRELK